MGVCFRGHSIADPEDYRSKEEVEEMMEHDPILLFAKHLRKKHRVKDADLDVIEVDAAVGGGALAEAPLASVALVVETDEASALATLKTLLVGQELGLNVGVRPHRADVPALGANGS